MQFAKMCFEELHGEGSTEAKALYESIYNLLQDMFNEYNERYNKKANVQQSQSQSRSTHASQSTQDIMEFVDDDEDYRRIEKRYNTLLKDIGVRNTNELDTYLKDKIENPDLVDGMEYNVLNYWRKNNDKYPILSEMGRDLFSMQMSSVASESAFSTSGRIIEPYRSCLTHYMVEFLICTEQ
ncbi:putative AC transposase [Cardamine amara subsp. amara]|uniref:AC transposase n=1 Tax=Cardamine amara subsp. amara TaxID=228776 RepID=A0ABD1AHA7_CARAN